jgi:hypothetical protein
VFEFAGAATGDHRNVHRLGYRPGEFKVVAAAGAIGAAWGTASKASGACSNVRQVRLTPMPRHATPANATDQRWRPAPNNQ